MKLLSSLKPDQSLPGSFKDGKTVYVHCSGSIEKTVTVGIAIACDGTKLPLFLFSIVSQKKKNWKNLRRFFIGQHIRMLSIKGVDEWAWSKALDSGHLKVLRCRIWSFSTTIGRFLMTKAAFTFRNDKFVWNRDGTYSWRFHVRPPAIICGRYAIIEGWNEKALYRVGLKWVYTFGWCSKCTDSWSS